MPIGSGGHLHGPIASVEPADVAMSGDGTTLYVAGVDGKVRVYDLATRTLEATWNVGTRLGGIDLSPDGDFLLVAERDINSRRVGDRHESTLTVYRIDTASGAVGRLSTTIDGFDRTFYDVAILSDGTALLTADAYSAFLPFWRLDLATGLFDPSEELFGVRPTITVSEDRSQALFAPPSSGGELRVFDVGAGFVHKHGIYQDDVLGSTMGRQAISLEANLIAQSVGNNVYIYDATLDYKFELGARHKAQHLGSNIFGLVFDASGENLFLLQASTSTIFQVATDDWSIVRTFHVGAVVGTESPASFGNRLLLSDDGRYFTVMTDTGLHLVENDALANVFTGTAAADDLDAGLGNDRIFGREGDDRLDGGAGADRLEGGPGDDHYLVDHYGDLIIELAGEGVDQVRSSASHGLDANVENLTLTGGAAIDGVGNALANVLTGNNGSNRLDGQGGADVMTGGLGHDTYVVDNAGDRIVEQASSGNDSVLSAISFSLPTHFEKLFLSGTAGIDGRGNAGANTLAGNRAANFLNGGRGNDVIDGGGGNDQIVGGDGGDTLKGGTGDDRFYFNAALGSSNVDRILDFSPADDVIRLDRSVFTRAGATGALKASAFHQGSAAADAGDRIVYDQAAGKIFYDADGTGSAAAILFATVAAGTPLTYADFTLYG